MLNHKISFTVVHYAFHWQKYTSYKKDGIKLKNDTNIHLGLYSPNNHDNIKKYLWSSVTLINDINGSND